MAGSVSILFAHAKLASGGRGWNTPSSSAGSLTNAAATRRVPALAGNRTSRSASAAAHGPLRPSHASSPSADRKFLDAGPVQPDLEAPRLTNSADDVATGSLQDDLDDVLAVGREMVANGETAARPKRQVFAGAILLQEQQRHAILRDARTDRGIGDGQASDAARRDKIAIQQTRRHRENVRDVVESVSRIVGRQIGARIDADAEKIADGVGIFRAVQPVHAWPAGVRRAHRRRVERRFERVRQRRVASLVGTT